MRKPWAIVLLCWGIALAAGCSPPTKDQVGDGEGGETPPPGGSSYDPETFNEHLYDILILDFRSGWWAGSAGDFHRHVLDPLRQADEDVNIEFHHFTRGQDIKCLYPPIEPASCETVTMSEGVISPEEVRARFEKEGWDDYTQIWILSGSEKDMSDIQVSGDLFEHFADQAGSSCVPFFIGAGDGFIDHGNALAQSVGIGPLLGTALAQPGFFFGQSPLGGVRAESHMSAGTELGSHELFAGVDVIADGVFNGFQHARGDFLVDNAYLDVIATDSTGRPVIGIGEIPLGGGDPRPFIVDAGMQRYYTVDGEPATLQLLKNILLYLGQVGCRAIID